MTTVQTWRIFVGKSYYIKKLTQFSLGWGSTMVWIYRIFNKLYKWRFVLGNFSCGWKEKYDRKKVGSFHYYSMGHHSMSFPSYVSWSYKTVLSFPYTSTSDFPLWILWTIFKLRDENLHYLLNPQFSILGLGKHLYTCCGILWLAIISR